jgi:hypothetical protein
LTEESIFHDRDPLKLHNGETETMMLA